jgi:hypothetical protein
LLPSPRIPLRVISWRTDMVSLGMWRSPMITNYHVQ